MSWLSAWRMRRRCFHHDWRTGDSWVRGFLVDVGGAKHFICRECGRYWT